MKGLALKVARNVVWVDVSLYRPTSKRETKTARLYHDFLRWSLDNDVMPVARGHSGPLGFSNGYRPRDAKKVLAWLAERGIAS